MTRLIRTIRAFSDARALRLAAIASFLTAVGIPVSQPDRAYAAQAGETGAFERRVPYEFPFFKRAEWLAFVAGMNDGAAVAEGYAALFSEEDFDRYRSGQRTRTSRITYRHDGLLINGFLVEPRTPGPHPVLIFNHGGVMQWGRIVLPELLEFNRLAERGYIVLASYYRGEGGSEGQPSMDGGDVSDTLALIALAEKMPNADAERIGMWGFSRGGFVTLGALKATDRLRAAAIVGAPTDLVNARRRAEFDEFVYPHVIRNYAQDKEGALARLSPIRWPERLAARTPILILHGGDDPRVEPTDSLRLAGELQRLQRSYRLKIYEGGSHALVENGVEVRHELDRWFDRYVRDRALAPMNGVTVLNLED